MSTSFEPPARGTRAAPDASADLARLPLLRELPAAVLARVAASAHVRDWPRGTFLWREGDEAGDPAFLLEGCVKMVRRADAGDVILELLAPGDPLGIVAVQGHSHYPASAMCVLDSRLLRLPAELYLELLEREPRFASTMAAHLAIRLQAMTRRVEELTGRRVEVRLARLLLDLAERFGRAEGDGLVLPLPLSRRELAELAGTTTESAIRALAGWERRGLIARADDGLRVPSPDALAALADRPS